MRIPAILSARIRGFRVVNVLGLGLLLALAVGGYTFKAMASAQDAKVAALDDQIGQETKRIHILKLEVARLGAGPRVEALSIERLGLGPTDPRRDINAEALPTVIAAAKAAEARPVAPGSGIRQ
jgi:hypothetical protein